MTEDEINAVADAVTERIGAGIWRLPDQVRDWLKNEHQAGYVGIPVALTRGPDALMLHSYVQPNGGGIQLELRDAYSSILWRGFIT